MISIDYLVFVHGKMGQNTECLSIFAHVTRANALIYTTADYKGPHPITLTISGRYEHQNNDQGSPKPTIKSSCHLQ